MFTYNFQWRHTVGHGMGNLAGLFAQPVYDGVIKTRGYLLCGFRRLRCLSRKSSDIPGAVRVSSA
jgi:hypothetical protein